MHGTQRRRRYLQHTAERAPSISSLNCSLNCSSATSTVSPRTMTVYATVRLGMPMLSPGPPLATDETAYCVSATSWRAFRRLDSTCEQCTVCNGVDDKHIPTQAVVRAS